MCTGCVWHVLGRMKGKGRWGCGVPLWVVGVCVADFVGRVVCLVLTLACLWLGLWHNLNFSTACSLVTTLQTEAGRKRRFFLYVHLFLVPVHDPTSCFYCGPDPHLHIPLMSPTLWYWSLAVPPRRAGVLKGQLMLGLCSGRYGLSFPWEKIAGDTWHCHGDLQLSNSWSSFTSKNRMNYWPHNCWT